MVWPNVFNPNIIIIIASVVRSPVIECVYKSLSSCSICDYASRVKHNTVKHLKLHLKEDKLIEFGAIEEISLPTVTPVNPSLIEETETSAYSRMRSLLPEAMKHQAMSSITSSKQNEHAHHSACFLGLPLPCPVYDQKKFLPHE